MTGYLVERLPPGQSCVENDGHRASLAAYLDAIRRAQELDRRLVRQHATDAFTTEQIVDALIGSLPAVRAVG